MTNFFNPKAKTLFPSSTLTTLLFLLLSLHPPFSHQQQQQPSSSSSSSIHDLLISNGLPAGLLPKEVKSYTLTQDGHLEVLLNGPCMTKYENRVYFESVVRANLTYGSLTGVMGLTQEELFLWLPVKDIIVDDPTSGLILFDIGFVHKQFSLSLFESPPHCGSQGVLKNHVRKDREEHEAVR